MRPCSHRSEGSFTLVEILAAMAVLSVLFTILFSILQQTSRGWQAANRRVEASQAVRLAMDQISADLENCVALAATGRALPQTNNGTNLTTNYAFGFVHHDGTRATNPTWLPTGATLSQPNDFIFVVTPYQPSQAFGSGDLAEVGYVPVRVMRASSGDGYGNVRIGRYALLRSFPVRFANATGATRASTNAQPITDFLTRPTDWETTPGVRNDGTATNFFPILDNCLGFDVRFVYGSGAGTASSPTWGRPQVTGVWGPRGTHPTNAPNGLPLAAVVTVCVVDDRTAERLYRMASNGLSRADLSNVVASVTNVGAFTNISDVGLRQTLREGVLGFQRQVFFKNAAP